MSNTLEAYNKLQPWTQGYVSYYQSELPGSEAPKENPYPISTPDHEEWKAGNFQAMLEVQDSEE